MKVRTEARRDAIISEATVLFCEMGYERASMSELASRLGGSKATLYGYFPSKQELFVAVVETTGEDLLKSAVQELVEPDGRDLRELLSRFGEVMVTLINKPRAFEVYRMVISESGRSDIGELFFDVGPRRVVNSIRDVLADAIERGVLRSCDPNIAAQHFLALIKAQDDEHLFQRSPAKCTRAHAREVVQQALDVFMHGYAVADEAQ